LFLYFALFDYFLRRDMRITAHAATIATIAITTPVEEELLSSVSVVVLADAVVSASAVDVLTSAAVVVTSSCSGAATA